MARVVMVLASGPGEPAGNLEYRMELEAALTPQAGLDGEGPWPATRLLPDGEERPAEVVRVDEGFAMQGPAGADSALWDFEGRVFRPGEYVTLRQPAGEEFVFRIVGVEPD